jgi:hypothetical protein
VARLAAVVRWTGLRVQLTSEGSGSAATARHTAHPLDRPTVIRSRPRLRRKSESFRSMSFAAECDIEPVPRPSAPDRPPAACQPAPPRSVRSSSQSIRSSATVAGPATHPSPRSTRRSPRPPADDSLTLQTALLHHTPGRHVLGGRHADDSRQVEFREAMMDRCRTALSGQPPAPELWVEFPSHFGLVLTRPILVDHEIDLSDPTARLLVDGCEGSVSVLFQQARFRLSALTAQSGDIGSSVSVRYCVTRGSAKSWTNRGRSSLVSGRRCNRGVSISVTVLR